MASSNDLVGLGMPPALASLEGFTSASITGVGTAQSGGAAINRATSFVIAVTDTGTTAFVLPSDAPLFRPYIVWNSTATAALVFPPSGSNINAAAGDASVSIATQLGRSFMRVSATHWLSWLTA